MLDSAICKTDGEAGEAANHEFFFNFMIGVKVDGSEI
jgi:hypothetical protein